MPVIIRSALHITGVPEAGALAVITAPLSRAATVTRPRVLASMREAGELRVNGLAMAAARQ